MEKVLTNSQHYTDIADAIRSKNGSGNTYKPSEMAEAILALEGGGELEEGYVTPTGQEFTEYPIGDGFSSVTVAGDYNLTPENIAEGITIYGVEGTLKIGASSTIPPEYEFFVEHAKLLYTGDYANLAILESNNKLNVAFLMDDFTVLSYDAASTEFTAKGWLYCEYTKDSQTWRIVDYRTVASTGTNYVKHIRYSSVYWEYNGQIIWPVGAVETVAGGHMVKFYDEFNEPLDIRSVRDGATVNAPVYKVKYWQGEDGAAVAFPAIITADLIVVAVNSSTAGEIYEHYSIDSGTYPYLYITFRKGMKQIVIVFAKAIVNTNQLSDALYADASVTEMLDPENDMATFLNVLYANVTELSARSIETMWDRDYMLTTFDMPNPENYSGKIIRID